MKNLPIDLISKERWNKRVALPRGPYVHTHFKLTLAALLDHPQESVARSNTLQRIARCGDGWTIQAA